jgi:hypothetical protein
MAHPFAGTVEKLRRRRVAILFGNDAGRDRLFQTKVIPIPAVADLGYI